uniref:Uncharacterized protein n=1 Tax=Leersia perrieri TaxID=77586 RepID=A0A0D9WXJ9_9ORYZ
MNSASEQRLRGIDNGARRSWNWFILVGSLDLE